MPVASPLAATLGPAPDGRAWTADAVAGLLADYRFDDNGATASGATAPDSSGLGHDMTLHNGFPFVSWDAAGCTFNQTDYGVVPAAVTAAFLTAYFVIDKPTGSYAQPNLFTDSAGFSCDLVQNFARDEMFPGLFAINSKQCYGPVAGGTPAVVAVVWDPAEYRVYVNGRRVLYFQTTSLSQRQGAPTRPASTMRFMNRFSGKVYRAAFYDEVHSEADVLFTSYGLRASVTGRGIVPMQSPPGTDSNLVWIGDSRTAAFNVAHAGLVTTRTYTRYNYGVGGINSANCALLSRDVAPLYKPAAARNVARVWIGVNDGDATGVTPFNNTKLICRDLKDAGFTVLVATEISSRGSGDAYKNAYNTLVLDGSTGLLALGLADAVIRYDQTALGPDGAYTDAGLFTDAPSGLHPTDAANQTHLYPLDVAAINALG